MRAVIRRIGRGVALGFACGALVLVLAGCDHVSSKYPVGSSPLAVEEEDWQGTWLHADGAIILRVVDSELGLLEAAWVEEKGGEFVLETVRVHLRQHGGWTFASFAGVEDLPDFLWSRLEREGRETFLWWPRPDEFQRLVEAGLLPGEVGEDSDVTLDRLGDEQLAILISEEDGVLFDWDEPMTFRRLQ